MVPLGRKLGLLSYIKKSTKTNGLCVKKLKGMIDNMQVLIYIFIYIYNVMKL